MCGRYMLTQPAEALRVLFGFIDQPAPPPRYNIAPTQDVAVVRQGGDGTRRLATLRWGLVSPRAQDIDPARPPIINARAETVMEKPSFRTAFMRRRCLIPADGFFEWQRRDPAPDGTPGRKQPYRIGLAGWRPFAFAGIWEHWAPKHGSGTAVPSCALLTTGANPLVARVHPRMPVILAPADYGRWLDADAEAADLTALLHPYPADAMDLYPVHSKVGNPRNDAPGVIEKLSLTPTAAPGPARRRAVAAAPPHRPRPCQPPPHQPPPHQAKTTAPQPPAETMPPPATSPAADSRPATGTETRDMNRLQKNAGPKDTGPAGPDRRRAVRTARRKPVQQRLF